MAVLTALSFFPFSIDLLLPSLPDGVYHAGPQGLAWMTSALGVGALTTSLFIAQRGHIEGLAAFVVRAGLPLSTDVAVATAADGLSAAEFDSGSYKTEANGEGVYPAQMIVAVPGGDAAAVVRAVTRGRIIGMASNQARAPGVMSVPVMCSIQRTISLTLRPSRRARRRSATASRSGTRIWIFCMSDDPSK